MLRKFVLLTALAGVFTIPQSLAQISASLQQEDPSTNLSLSYTTTTGEDWTIYMDKENKTFYIDFETLTVNLSDIVLRNEKGEILMQDSVFELPVNTIYELDLSTYAAGQYEVELRSFNGVIRKTIELRG